MTNAEIIDVHDGLKELHDSKIPLKNKEKINSFFRLYMFII